MIFGSVKVQKTNIPSQTITATMIFLTVEEPKSLKVNSGDFPDSPLVKTSPSNAGSTDSISGQGARFPHALQPKNQNLRNRSNIVTNSIKTSKQSMTKNLNSK